MERRGSTVAKVRWVSTMVAAILLAIAPRAFSDDSNLPPAGQLVQENLDHLKADLTSANSTTTNRDEAARRLVSRHTSDADTILTQVLANPGNALDPAKLSIARALADAPDPEPRFEESMASLMGNRTVAEGAAAALGRYAATGNLQAQQRLLAVAQDSALPAAIRDSAIRALGNVVNQTVANTLVGLLNDPRPAVKLAANDALIQMTGRADLNHNDQGWQQWSVQHQGLNDVAWREQVLQSRSAHQESQLRSATGTETALKAILDKLYADAQQRKDEAAVKSLILQYLSSSDPALRANGIDLVSNAFLGGQTYPTIEAHAKIKELVGDSDPTVRQRAAETLAKLNIEGALPVLITQAAQEPDPAVERVLVASIGQLRDKRAVGFLEEKLNSPAIVLSVASKTADALDLIASDDPELRAQVAGQLWNAAQRAANSNRPDGVNLQAIYVQAMGPLSQASYASKYLPLLSDPHPELRIAAFHAMGELHDPNWAYQMAQKLSNEGSPQVRIAAIEGLGEIGNFESVARAIYDESTVANELDKQVRSKAWDVFQQSLRMAQSASALQYWVDQLQNQPDRQIVVLEAIINKLQLEAQNAPPDQRKDLLDNIASYQQTAGKTYMDLKNPQRAAALFRQALDHYEPPGQPVNLNQVTLTLVNQLMKALLDAKEYDQAVRFAREESARNAGAARGISAAIRNRADELATAGGANQDRPINRPALADAMKLIDAAQSDPNLELAPNDKGSLARIKSDIQDTLAGRRRPFSE